MTTIVTVSGGGLWVLFSRMEINKKEASNDLQEFRSGVDLELDAFRIAAYTEYKELRREHQETIDKAYRELSEAPLALRQKINEVELWMRDFLLPRRDYERDQDRLTDSINSLAGTAIKRLDSIEKKFDEEKSARIKELSERRRG